MVSKILITINENDVAPRFDLTTEVLIATVGSKGNLKDQKTMVLPRASPEELCHLILTEGVQVVVCGGIEEEYYQYLMWKKVEVMDSTMGPWVRVLERLEEGSPGQG